MNLADQVAALTELVRVLVALGALSLVLNVVLVVWVRLLSVRVKALDEFVRHVEGDAESAQETANTALELARRDAAAEELAFIRRTERPRATGGE